MNRCRLCEELSDSGWLCRDCALDLYTFARGKAFVLSQEVSYYEWRFQVKADTPVKKGELIRFGRFILFEGWEQLPEDWRAYEESLIKDYCLDVCREEEWLAWLRDAIEEEYGNGYKKFLRDLNGAAV